MLGSHRLVLAASGLASIVAALFLCALACGGTKQAASVAPTSDAGGGAPLTCPPCVADGDCGGGVCAQVGGDAYCMPRCPNGNECASDRACAPVVTVSGDTTDVCAPLTDVCAIAPADAGSGVDSGMCGPLAPPTTPSTCKSRDGGVGSQPNGCSYGRWCNTSSGRCQSPPATCNGGVSYDGGAPVTGTVGSTGGAVSRLFFACVGDTRPATPDDTAGYPTAIIDTIFTSMASMSPRPPFVVSTGDYMFATTYGTESSTQLDLYVAARSKYAGVQFPALGNHECTGATASNCGAGNANGITANYTAFLTKLLGPIQQTLPYYVVHLSAQDASWTAKLVFIAANAWDDGQATWLEQALTETTTYTFVVRHEPAAANTAPGVTPSEAIMARHPYTLAIVGHSHSYGHPSAKEILVGNGGAPLSGGGNFGFALFSQEADGTIDVDMIDYMTKLADPGFHSRVKADGTVAP